jgi:hypothetical protein
VATQCRCNVSDYTIPTERPPLVGEVSMKAYGGVDVQIHIFLTSALVGGEWSASRPGRFTPRETAPGTHCIGGWVDPRAGLDNMEK